jgi:hypothetical protein
MQSINLRAIATIARLPPALALICSYFLRMALSFLINIQQDSTKAERTVFLPAPVMRPILILSALEYCDGVNPTYAANCSARRKREKSCNSNKISMAVNRPMPGIEHKIFTRSRYNGIWANCFSNWVYLSIWALKNSYCSSSWLKLCCIQRFLNLIRCKFAKYT